MTGCDKQISSYNPTVGYFNDKIDGESLSIIVKGTKTIQINQEIELHYVLHILNLACNLLAINKFNKIIKVSCSFFYCLLMSFIQDLTSKNEISNSKENKWLYYLIKIKLNKQY